VGVFYGYFMCSRGFALMTRLHQWREKRRLRRGSSAKCWRISIFQRGWRRRRRDIHGAASSHFICVLWECCCQHQSCHSVMLSWFASTRAHIFSIFSPTHYHRACLLPSLAPASPAYTNARCYLPRLRSTTTFRRAPPPTAGSSSCLLYRVATPSPALARAHRAAPHLYRLLHLRAARHHSLLTSASRTAAHHVVAAAWRLLLHTSRLSLIRGIVAQRAAT